MSIHSRGPWMARKFFDDWIIVGQGEASSLALVRSRAKPEITKANAELMATAPELLASCRELREAAAACFRVVAALGEVAINALDAELSISGLRREFGTRAAQAIDKAEGK